MLIVVLVLVCLFIMTAGAALVAHMEDRRVERADIAGWEAAEAWRRRAADPPLPPGLDVHLTDWGQLWHEERWHWTVWRSDANEGASDLVKGVLVPAAMGNAATPEDAERAAMEAIVEWQKATGWNGPVRILNSADL